MTINNRQTDYIRADDIKHPGRLTPEQISSIPVAIVFEWVKTGKWKKKDFVRWLDNTKENK